MMDLTGLFRVWNPQYKSYSVFGQDHLAKVLLNWDTSVGGHDAGGCGAREGVGGRERRLCSACSPQNTTRVWALWRGALSALTPPAPSLSPAASPAPPPPTRRPAVGDALKSIRLFKLYQQLQASPPQWAAAQAALLATPPAPSFARQNPSFEGVCMGNRKTCTCGAPFLG